MLGLSTDNILLAILQQTNARKPKRNQQKTTENPGLIKGLNINCRNSSALLT